MSDQLARLARPFPHKLVNPPAKGKYGSYVSHDVVTQKLLAICGPYDFSIDEVVKGADGNVEAILATLTLEIDGVRRSVTEVGDCEFPEQKKTQGERLKDCASDAIKRCAMRFGVGLHLWSGDQYFLYDQLEKRDGLTTSRAPLISTSRREHVKERIMALSGAHGVSVADARAEYDLPPPDRATPEELGAWEALLTDLESKLEAPFVEETGS